jgi:hypothetical protein
MKGQIAFESLFLFLIIISAASFISLLYMQTHSDTILYSSLRTELVKQANGFDKVVIIEGIDFSTTTNSLHVTTSPNTLISNSFDSTAIQEIITKHSKLENTSILFNAETSS